MFRSHHILIAVIVGFLVVALSVNSYIYGVPEPSRLDENDSLRPPLSSHKVNKTTHPQGAVILGEMIHENWPQE